MRGYKYHYKRATIGPSAKRNLMAFRWRANGRPTLNAGLVALRFYRESGPVLQRNPIFFRQGRCPDPLPPPPPPLDPRMQEYHYLLNIFNYSPYMVDSLFFLVCCIYILPFNSTCCKYMHLGIKVLTFSVSITAHGLSIYLLFIFAFRCTCISQ